MSRIILCTSDCGYSWVERVERYDHTFKELIHGYRAGFTVYSGRALEADGVLADIYVTATIARHIAEHEANEAFVAHHAHEVDLDEMCRPLQLGERTRRWNPFTILRSSWG